VSTIGRTISTFVKILAGKVALLAAIMDPVKSLWSNQQSPKIFTTRFEYSPSGKIVQLKGDRSGAKSANKQAQESKIRRYGSILEKFA
jgi:hypothetical protein